jgi:hypothetical protein
MIDAPDLCRPGSAGEFRADRLVRPQRVDGIPQATYISIYPHRRDLYSAVNYVVCNRRLRHGVL